MNVAGNDEEMIVLGRISGVFGVKGWLKVYSYTDPMEAIVQYKSLYIKQAKDGASWHAAKLLSGKRQAKTVVMQLEDCSDRNLAENYIGYEIAVSQKQLEQYRGTNEFYWRDLIGLQVRNAQMVEFGTVKSLMETGANDVLVVKSDDSDQEFLIPWAFGESIVSVNLAESVIEVDWQKEWCD